MSTISKIIIMSALAVAVPVSAQPPTAYTLKECRTLALENNARLKNAAHSVAAAREGKREAFTKYFPEVSASGGAFNANKGLLQLEMMPGMSMSMLKNGVLGSITVTQPLFAGGQIVNGNRLASVGVDVSRIQQEQTADEVLLTVEQYFWQIATLAEKLQTLNVIERQLEGISNDVEAAVNAGVTTRNDLLQVQLKRNDVRSSRVSLENNMTLLRMLLAQHIGLGKDTIDITADIPTDAVPEFPRHLYCIHEDALHQTTGFRLLENNVRANRLQQRMAVGKNLPTVAVGAGYMYDNLMDKSHPFGMAFVTVSVPISGWWGGSHAIKQQRLQVINAENTLSDNSQLLVIGMQKAWNNLCDSYEQIRIASGSIEQSTENLRLHTDYYRTGTATMTDLLEAQSLFQQSRDKYVEAYSQFMVRQAEYLNATGRMGMAE